DSGVGTTVVSLTATTDGTVSAYTVTGVPSKVEIATVNVGIVTLTTTVDYETDAELVLTIIATDSDGPQQPRAVTIRQSSNSASINERITYNDMTMNDTDFDVGSTDGAVTTAAGVTLDKATKDEYTVAISGTVTGGESNVLTLTVKVGDCSGKEKMAAALGSLLLSLLLYTSLSL
ncbi:hypothetical protein MAR_036020, partial [Mya arenaria]